LNLTILKELDNSDVKEVVLSLLYNILSDEYSTWLVSELVSFSERTLYKLGNKLKLKFNNIIFLI